jgi:hypothetical protein
LRRGALRDRQEEGWTVGVEVRVGRGGCGGNEAYSGSWSAAGIVDVWARRAMWLRGARRLVSAERRKIDARRGASFDGPGEERTSFRNPNASDVTRNLRRVVPRPGLASPHTPEPCSQDTSSVGPRYAASPVLSPILCGYHYIYDCQRKYVIKILSS